FRQILSPLNFRVKTCDTKREPFFVSLNWDTSVDSGIVDMWKIERAKVNNFAASTLNVTNTKEISQLKFTHIANVLMESSRGRSRVDDARDIVGDTISRKNKVLSGNHNFIDEDVEFGN